MTNSTALDLHDIQGNIVKAYGRYGFPRGRYVLFSVCNGAAGRKFVQALAPTITTSAPPTTPDAHPSQRRREDARAQSSAASRKVSFISVGLTVPFA